MKTLNSFILSILLSIAIMGITIAQKSLPDTRHSEIYAFQKDSLKSFYNISRSKVPYSTNQSIVAGQVWEVSEGKIKPVTWAFLGNRKGYISCTDTIKFNGSFHIKANPGKDTFNIGSIGYLFVSVKLNLVARDSVYINIYLAPDLDLIHTDLFLLKRSEEKEKEMMRRIHNLKEKINNTPFSKQK